MHVGVIEVAMQVDTVPVENVIPEGIVIRR